MLVANNLWRVIFDNEEEAISFYEKFLHISLLIGHEGNLWYEKNDEPRYFSEIIKDIKSGEDIKNAKYQQHLLLLNCLDYDVLNLMGIYYGDESLKNQDKPKVLSDE